MDRRSASPAEPPATGGFAARIDCLGWRVIESLSAHALFLLGVSGTVLSWTKTAERIHGWSASQIIGNRKVTRDISERAETEASLRKINTELEARLGLGVLQFDPEASYSYLYE